MTSSAQTVLKRKNVYFQIIQSNLTIIFSLFDV